jgi:hypothetical protein
MRRRQRPRTSAWLIRGHCTYPMTFPTTTQTAGCHRSPRGRPRPRTSLARRWTCLRCSSQSRNSDPGLPTPASVPDLQRAMSSLLPLRRSRLDYVPVALNPCRAHRAAILHIAQCACRRRLPFLKRPLFPSIFRARGRVRVASSPCRQHCPDPAA